jgi:hypothetical protein
MEFDFEELMADILGISDEQREDTEAVSDAIYEKFGIHTEEAFNLTLALLQRTPKVKAGFSGKLYHAFVNKDDDVMLMKVEAK